MEKKKYFPALILIFIAGGLDAFCYIMHDGMFAAMQTGNMIQIAIKLARCEFVELGKYFLSILAFVLGIIVAHLLSKVKRYEIISICSSILCYTIGLLIPVGALNSLSNLIIAFGVAIQLQVIRSISGFTVATTMCTGNLKGFAECTGQLITTRDKKYLLGMLIYSTLIISFMLGVFVVALIIK